MKIGFTELLVVLIVALFVIGPDKLPEFAKKLGEALAEFRRYSESATKDIKESIVEPLEEAQKPLREAIEPLRETEKEIRGNVKELQSSIEQLGKPAGKPEQAEAAPEPEEALDKNREMPENEERSNEDEDRNHGTAGDSGSGSDYLWTDTDSEADQDVREEREEL